MNKQLERFILARDELVRLNDKIYDLMTAIHPATADNVEETIDQVSILMEEIIERMVKRE